MSGDLPDHQSPMDHAEKIAWMIEANGWALEVVPPRVEPEPQAGCAYTVGLPAAVGFPDVIVFGLTPVAARGVLELVVDICRTGSEIPLGAPLTGVFDGGLRCMFAPVDIERWGHLVTTLTAWTSGEPVELVQLLWPDRRGVLPHETGFDHRLRTAQPVIGMIGGGTVSGTVDDGS